jgi:5-formyltetrahydrofolate cyclo-ligase
MVSGIWNIPVPADGGDIQPDIVIPPVVGFDREGLRLDHGGGFYDRTRVAMACMPKVIGVGIAMSAVATIYPRPHDVRMQLIVTERGPGSPVEP